MVREIVRTKQDFVCVVSQLYWRLVLTFNDFVVWVAAVPVAIVLTTFAGIDTSQSLAVRVA